MSIRELEPFRVARHQHGPGSMHILGMERGESFVPGQVVGLTTDPSIPLRWYSVASAPESDTMEILYQVLPEGELTPRLESLEPGSRVWMSPVLGNFTLPGTLTPEDEVWWICNGTGIAPFRSMIRGGDSGCRVLVHGVRDPEDHQALGLEARDGLTKVVCVSQGKVPRDGAHWPGRLTDWLVKEAPVERLRQAKLFMLCGSDGMIITVREYLMSRGVSHERIISEVYF